MLWFSCEDETIWRFVKFRYLENLQWNLLLKILQLERKQVKVQLDMVEIQKELLMEKQQAITFHFHAHIPQTPWNLGGKWILANVTLYPM